MITYSARCPLCGERIESFDSQSDAYIERDDHMIAKHPDQPDPTFDPRFKASR